MKSYRHPLGAAATGRGRGRLIIAGAFGRIFDPSGWSKAIICQPSPVFFQMSTT